MKKEKEKRNNYIFPNFLAQSMKSMDVKTQLESAMMSMVLLLIGMILMSIYTVIYLGQGWIFKGLILFNVIAGFIFMSSYLVTTYQQYVSYMAAIEVQTIMETKTNHIKENPRKISRLNQFLFFGGIILILVGLGLSYFLDNYYYTGISILGVVMATSVFFRKVNKKQKQKEEVIEQSLNQEIEEINQQQELDNMETGMDEYLDNQIKTDETEYMDFTATDEQPKTQPQNKRQFRGRDGRIYFN